MPPNSQGGIVMPSFSGISRERPATESLRSMAPPNPNPHKRPRLSLSQDKENACRQTSTAANMDEKRMMEDLMAGLDASVFEMSSPIKSQSQALSQKQALSPSPRVLSKVKQHAPSLAKSRHISSRPQSKPIEVKLEENVIREPPSFGFRPVKRSPGPVGQESKVQVNVKREIKAEPEVTEPVPLPPNSQKPEFVDEDDYSFDLDLVDLANFDEDLLLKQHNSSKPLFPVLHPPVPPAPPGYASIPWARCTVDAVLTGLRFGDGIIPLDVESAANEGPSNHAGKTILVTIKTDGTRKVVHVKDRWADTPLRKGDIVNVISPSLNSTTSKPIEVAFKSPNTYLIHHPDTMLTMTSIAGAMPCPRKPLLQSLVKPAAPPSKAILYGTIQHSLLQSALSEQGFSVDDTRRRLDEELKKEERRLEIWGAGLGIEDVRLEVGDRAGKGFQTFGDKWVTDVPRAEGELHAVPGDDPSLLAINGLHDIEEDIWSPKWGLKGKVDASVQAKIIRDPRLADQVVEENVAPLEIKTGRAVGVMAHRAQTMLYTLLMEDRYNVPVPAGLLYYSQLDSILRVEARPNEIRALIMARNEIADWQVKKRVLPVSETKVKVDDMEDAAFLPATVDHARECRSCYAVDSCMLYRKAVDAVPHEPDNPIAELYEQKAGHLTTKDTEFFKKWETLLTIEEEDINRFRSQLWTMTASQREKSGRCFSDMVIKSYSNDLGKSLAKIHRHAYTFERASHAGTQSDRSLLSGHIAKGDPVSLSIEPDLLCLSRGFVIDLTSSTITIGVTYVIDVDALLARTRHRHRATGGDRDDQVVFRIDKDEMASGMMRMRNNLAQLFYVEGDEKRRKLIVDLAPPQYEDARAPRPEEIPSSLNEDQRQAMEKVMTAQDYALILGMPGTGKTTTIAEIIKALVERGKTVLLTSYTHSAVDTILMKLLNAEFPMLRLGNIDKVHPDVQHLTLEAMPSSSSMAQLDARLMGPPVVAATCLAIDHPVFFRRKFDYCIVDEASQITLPTCLGPLRMADTFILVGDHFQLPPIVRNAEARRGGLDVSLFRLLSEAHPSAVVDLSHQYRMNEDIMLLSNHLIYENRLKCGSEAVAKQSLVLPNRKACEEWCAASKCAGDCWIQGLLDESAKAVFVDTDDVPALDSRIGDLVQNETEGTLVHQLANALTANGIKQQDIAVITPYRQQIKLLNGRLASLPKIEILTADKSQGRDKDCVIISLVRSNEIGNIGDLLRDWRRINVSFTRAKKKLVIFGSARTLGSDKLLKGFLDLMEGKGWVVKLKKGAEGLHPVAQPMLPVLKPGSPNAIRYGVDKTMGKEDLTVCTSGDTGQVRVKKGGKGILSGRPFIKEVVEGQ